MSYATILTELKESVFILTLNRPEAMNAFDREMIREVSSALENAEKEEEVKVVIITGKGKAFCAGADLREITSFLEGSHVKSLDFDNFSQTLNGMLEKIQKLRKPVIAAINGHALAGGLELAMVCDLAVCAANAKLGDQHANVGLIPGSGGSQRLPRLIGLRKAMELLLTGDTISAEEAERLGLINKVVRPEELLEASMELAGKIAKKSPLVSRALKTLVYQGIEVGLDTALELERGALVRHHSTQDMREGIQSFLEKRKPVFTGR